MGCVAHHHLALKCTFLLSEWMKWMNPYVQRTCNPSEWANNRPLGLCEWTIFITICFLDIADNIQDIELLWHGESWLLDSEPQSEEVNDPIGVNTNTRKSELASERKRQAKPLGWALRASLRAKEVNVVNVGNLYASWNLWFAASTIATERSANNNVKRSL